MDHEPERGVIVFLDRLGTKGIWRTTNPNKVLEHWQELIDEFKNLTSRIKDDLDKYRFRSEIGFQAFSDTVIISLHAEEGASPVNDINRRTPSWWNIMSLGEYILLPIFKFAILKKIYFRGCISVGEFYRSNYMIIGPAVDEAASYYMLPKWIGISTAPSASLTLRGAAGNSKQMASQFFVQYDIPLENRIEKNGWALNWPKNYGKEIEDHFLDELNIQNMDYEDYLKVKNTLDFYRFCIPSS